jgi:multicomponent Na+:H+ antiporter subunit E
MSPSVDPPFHRIRPLPAIRRLLLAALVWWALTEGDPRAWAIGAPVILLVAIASLRCSGTTRFRLHPLGALRFALFFLRSSAIAGIDVARRALLPAMPLDPGLVTVHSRLPAGVPRWLLATTLSLVPGSLVVELEDGRFVLHCLDRRKAVADEVRATERRVAALFGLPLEPA